MNPLLSPKDEARELYKKFIQLFSNENDEDQHLKAVKCALITVNKIISELECAYNGEPITTNEHKIYWHEVKNKLKRIYP